MTFEEILAQVRDQLQREQRVAYRILKREFDLSDADLEDLKADLIDAKQVAADEGGKVLVWVGPQAPLVSSAQPSAQATSDAAGRLADSQSLDAGRETLETQRETAERRQLTVMFCDMVGFTVLSERLDPEELRELIRAYQDTCAEVVGRLEGHIAQYLGDGLLVYFGYPRAHEDDAQRAVRAGLEIVTALRTRGLSPVRGNEQVILTQRLQVRIGIHTGTVVVGEMGGAGRREQLALGETPNIAARLQGLTEPDSVVVSAATYRLVRGLFEGQDLGPQILKGISDPIAVYRVVGPGTAQSRFDVASSGGLTPLVGREEELGVLRRRWEQSKQWAGQVVLLSGEAGIGKSRLVQTLKEQVIAEGATRLEIRCSPYHRHSAFHPIIEHLQRLLQFTSNEPVQAKLAKLQRAVAAYHFAQADTLPLLASLLSLPHPEGAPPLRLNPQKQKQRTQETLVAWLVDETRNAAVYCAWEDLHWADPSTMEVLTLFLDQVPTTRLLALLTFRPDFTPPWGSRSYLSQLTLNRLDARHVEAMVARVTGGIELSAEVLRQIVAKTDGVPLFIEELTKMVLESETYAGAHGQGACHAERAIAPLGIPATLHDALMARLDRLNAAKEIAQLGATLGREFSYELLHAVSPSDEETLRRGLRQLVDAELIYQRGLPPQANYLFKHAPVQDAAYHSLLKSRRLQIHQHVAQVLEERFPEINETQPELLAHHYTEAGRVSHAIPYWERAGQRAIERSANIEAISHLNRGLRLLKTLPETLERAKQELTLQVSLGVPLIATQGYAAPEVEKAYTRARELCQQTGESEQLFPVLGGLWQFHVVRAEYQTVRELGELILSLAQKMRDSAFLVEGHDALGQTFFCLGEFGRAQAHLDQALLLYEPQHHRTLTFLCGGEDPGIACRGFAAWNLWLCGYPDRALQRNLEALRLAQEVAHPFSLAHALAFTAGTHLFRGETREAQKRAEALIALSTEHGFAFFSAFGRVFRALVEPEQREEELVRGCQAMVDYRATGAELLQPYFLALLAELYGEVRQIQEGLSLLGEALDRVYKTEERWYEAELYRLKGQLLLNNPRSSIPLAQLEAEECLLKAIEIARNRKAKSLELRAALTLSQLWGTQDKKQEGRSMLTEIYPWFTEGFDTGDLREAKVALERLR